MASGIVTATSLNLRSAPNGSVITALRFGSRVTILSRSNGWLSVSSAEGVGFVASHYVKLDEVASPTLLPSAVPPRDDGAIRSDDDHAYAPDGSRFATKHGAGFVVIGTTSLDSFVSSVGEQFSAVPASLLRVMQSVSNNEGKLEAVNSYDSNFMSFGVFQWTAGGPGESGELAALLNRIRQKNPSTFQEFFGFHRLDVVLTASDKVPYGFLILDGKRLQSEEDKAPLRSALWAYRFWRAGHDEVVRTCQVEHAASRIDAFYDANITTEAPSVPGGRLHDYISSEYGIALILDEHVNRPGHVPATLTKAIDLFLNDTHRTNPLEWTTADERRVLELYLQFRAETNMTNSGTRAMTIANSGRASIERGSFRRS